MLVVEASLSDRAETRNPRLSDMHGHSWAMWPETRDRPLRSVPGPSFGSPSAGVTHKRVVIHREVEDVVYIQRGSYASKVQLQTRHIRIEIRPQGCTWRKVGCLGATSKRRCSIAYLRLCPSHPRS